MRKCVFLLASLLLIIAGCEDSDKPRFTKEELAKIPLAQKTGFPEPSGGFVLAVGDETITDAEIITEPLLEYYRPIAQNNDFATFRVRAREQIEKIIVGKASDILLLSRAKKDLGEQIDERLEKAAEAEVRKFILSFGGDYAKAQQSLKQEGMDWASFREFKKRQILSSSYVYQKLPQQKPVTYSELMDYYNEKKDELFVTTAMLRFRLIDIQPAKLEVADPNQTRQQLAKELASELIGRLRTGEDFGELAKQYSHGHRASFGGLWKQINPESLAEPYDTLAAEAQKIAPGQLAGPIDVPGHIFIMKLVDKRQQSIESFEDVQNQIEAKILLDRQRKALDELSAELVQQAALSQKNAFVEFCLKKIYRLSNQ